MALWNSQYVGMLHAIGEIKKKTFYENVNMDAVVHLNFSTENATSVFAILIKCADFRRKADECNY